MSVKALPIPSAAAALHRRFLSTDRGMLERFGDPFRPLEPECGVIQFSQPLAPAQLQRAGDLIADRPDVELYVYGRASNDLGFLRYFERVRRLHLALYDLSDIAGFTFLRGRLEELTLGETKKKFSLSFIAGFPRLKKLFLVGHKKDLQAIRALGELRSLGLSGITLPDLPCSAPRRTASSPSCWAAPRTLRSHGLAAGRSLPLPDHQALHVSVRRPPSLTTLRWTGCVMSRPPSLAGLARLDNVTLDTMKGWPICLARRRPGAAPPSRRRHASAHGRGFGCSSTIPGSRSSGLHRQSSVNEQTAHVPLIAR
jgi:hypothetical protein